MDEQTIEFCRKLQEDIKECVTGGVTVSIGCAAYPEKGKSPEELFNRADMAMYQAKTQNKNNCRH